MHELLRSCPQIIGRAFGKWKKRKWSKEFQVWRLVNNLIYAPHDFSQETYKQLTVLNYNENYRDS